MTFTMCTNLYVKEVQTEATFFKAIGFVEISRERMGEYETVVVAPTAEGNACLQIWAIDFIRQVSAEVADSKPSILFRVDNLEKMHAKVKAVAHFTNDIQMIGKQKTFNFQSPNGDYFAFSTF